MNPKLPARKTSNKTMTEKTESAAAVSSGELVVLPPITVRLEAPGLNAIYTLAGEHLAEVRKCLNECHALDNSKQRLIDAINARLRKRKS